MNRVCHCTYKIEQERTLLALIPILLEYARPVRKDMSDDEIIVLLQ